MATLQFEVRKDALDVTRLVEYPDEPLAPGKLRVRVDAFAYTANNITYAAFGDAMQYWQFYPVPPDSDGTVWGCIPVWGFAEVEHSQHPDVKPGERLYGYWPMASHAVLQVDRVRAGGFAEVSAHRAPLHAVYNQVSRCAADPFYSPDTEAEQALLRPLFSTAWLIDDFLAENSFFGTTAEGARGVMLLSSASSKTAYATAAHLARRGEIEVVGLTSAANLDFCRSLGVYSRVLAYDALDDLAADTRCVYVDFAGNAALRTAVHTRFARLAYSCSVGGTHVTQLAGSRGLPGPRPVLFFAPAQVARRHQDWGPAVFGQRLVDDWQRFLAQVRRPDRPWLEVQHHLGPTAVQAVHALMLGGGGDPRAGHLLSLHEPPASPR